MSQQVPTDPMKSSPTAKVSNPISGERLTSDDQLHDLLEERDHLQEPLSSNPSRATEDSSRILFEVLLRRSASEPDDPRVTSTRILTDQIGEQSSSSKEPDDTRPFDALSTPVRRCVFFSNSAKAGEPKNTPELPDRQFNGRTFKHLGTSILRKRPAGEMNEVTKKGEVPLNLSEKRTRLTEQSEQMSDSGKKSKTVKRWTKNSEVDLAQNLLQNEDFINALAIAVIGKLGELSRLAQGPSKERTASKSSENLQEKGSTATRPCWDRPLVPYEDDSE